MMNPILKFSLPLIMVISVSCTEDPEMKNAEEPVTGHVFPIGESFTSENFTGTAWLEMLVEDDGTLDTHIGNVTFEPGARTNWHYHPGGQILLATYGTGYYQEKGQPIQILQKGDAVKCPPDVEHWHGASPESKFTHVAIGPNLDRGGVVWLDPVTDEEYDQPNEPQQNRETEDYQVGNPLGLPVNPSAEDTFEEISPNVKVYGTIYTTQTGDFGEDADPDTWRVWKISPDREVSLFLQNEPLRMPNGIDFDLEGNIVVANFGNDEVLTFSPDGELLKTSQVQHLYAMTQAHINWWYP